jgi:hypothetical protein
MEAQIRDPVIDEQASLEGIDDVPGAPSDERHWQEATPVLPPEESEPPANEPTGTAGGGMPEAASQAENPGTDTDINLPPPKKRINLDRV